jgi:hypothetical protein
MPTMSYCRRIPLLLVMMPGALVTAQYITAVETEWAAVSTESSYIPISTETLRTPTTTETLTTTLTTRVPMPVAGYNALTASILSTASFLLQY